MLEYSHAFLEQNDRALDELLKLLTPEAAKAAEVMELEASHDGPQLVGPGASG